MVFHKALAWNIHLEVLMKSSTARRPDNQRPTRSTKPRKYVRQTAHFEARRDGKPIVFGWGGHLSRNEKNRLARRAVWAVTILFVVLIVVIVVSFWVNINIVVPNKTISSVNGQNIPQSDYHKMAVFRGIQYNNELNGVHGLIAQRDALQSKINATKDANQKTALNNQLTTLSQSTIPNIQTLFVQSPLSNEAAQWLQEDIILRNWLNKQSTAIQNQINPSDATITKAMNTFKANFPKGVDYNNFLSQNSVSDNDMRAMMAVNLRRDNMQTYQAALITSPTRQVKARIIVVPTTANAQSVIKQIKSGANFTKLAAANSQYSPTKSKDGELGWLVRGQYTKEDADNLRAVVDNWIFDPNRKVGDLSPDLNENGMEKVVQIEAIDPSRPAATATLNELKANALQGWLLAQKESYKITTPDAGMLTDPMNMPSFVPASAPQATATPGTTGTGG
jgi:parvulin-like peptidyl-prolyl isomerase